MPFSKNQVIRYKIINGCLRNPVKKYWSKEELIEEFKKADIVVNDRTVIGDIYNMRYNDQLKYHAPIIYSKYNKGYYYSNPDYSIESLPLNETDIRSLEFAAAILNQYKNIEVFNAFAGTVTKVIDLVNHLKSNYPVQSFIDFEKSSDSPGAQHLNFLINLIRENTVIELEYKRFDDHPKKHELSPYLLKEYRNRWYLLGFHHDAEKIMIFGLDRILSINPLLDSAFRISPDFNPATYFQNTMGITYTDSPVEEIILLFDPYQGNYLRSQPLHPTQEILEDDEEEFRIKLHLVPNYEFYSTILSYGANVEVLSPPSIRENIIQMLQDSMQLYK